MNKISVILPCAGSGTRLGLDTPKELYEIADGFRLIDFSLNHILKFKTANLGADIKVVTVIRPHKEAVFDYVADRLGEIKTEKAYFDDRYYDSAGSIYSANEYFSEFNIALLPDSVIRLAKDTVYTDKIGATLLEKMVSKLKDNKIVFAYQICSDKDKLAALGSLRVSDGEVLDFYDKPTEDFEKYNAFWTTYAFKKEYGWPLYNFVKDSVKHNNPDYSKQEFYPAAAIQVHSYRDLGTWKAIEEFRSKENIAEYII